MSKTYCLWLAILACLICMYGCSSLQYPPIQKRLFSWQIPRSQVDAVKETILRNGYQRITDNNYPYEGAFVTQYAKMVPIDSHTEYRVQVLLNFKEAGAPAGHYRNLGISVFCLERTDAPEIDAEVDRIEDLLYEKLIEVAGRENVERGERKSSRTSKPGFYAPYVGHPPPR